MGSGDETLVTQVYGMIGLRWKCNTSRISQVKFYKSYSRTGVKSSLASWQASLLLVIGRWKVWIRLHVQMNVYDIKHPEGEGSIYPTIVS